MRITRISRHIASWNLADRHGLDSDNGKPNVMTMGFHMMIQHGPALIGLSSGVGSQLSGSPENRRSVVIAVPGLDSRNVVDVGNCSGDRVNKFQRVRPQDAPPRTCSPAPLDCLANIECRVVDTRFGSLQPLHPLRRRGSGSTSRKEHE